MTYYREIIENSLLKRAKVKRDLIKILRKHGFKRSFLKYPASEIYVKGDSTARVYSKIKHSFGSRKHGIAPYDYGTAGVEIDDPTIIGSKIKEELHAYGEKGKKEHTKKREQKTSGIEKKVGVFIAFFIGGIALSFGSLTMTGNAVSNLTQTTPGLLGVFLFIAGLVGIFFCSRRK